MFYFIGMLDLSVLLALFGYLLTYVCTELFKIKFLSLCR